MLSPLCLRRVLEFMQVNVHTQPTLVELSRIAQVSTWHFAHAFRNSHGMSPVKQMNRFRVARAKDLLSKGSPVQAVARSIGIPSAGGFTNFLQRELGVSPREYMKAVQ